MSQPEAFDGQHDTRAGGLDGAAAVDLDHAVGGRGHLADGVRPVDGAAACLERLVGRDGAIDIGAGGIQDEPLRVLQPSQGVALVHEGAGVQVAPGGVAEGQEQLRGCGDVVRVRLAREGEGDEAPAARVAALHHVEHEELLVLDHDRECGIGLDQLAHDQRVGGDKEPIVGGRVVVHALGQLGERKTRDGLAHEPADIEALVAGDARQGEGLLEGGQPLGVVARLGRQAHARRLGPREAAGVAELGDEDLDHRPVARWDRGALDGWQLGGRVEHADVAPVVERVDGALAGFLVVAGRVLGDLAIGVLADASDDGEVDVRPRVLTIGREAGVALLQVGGALLGPGQDLLVLGPLAEPVAGAGALAFERAVVQLLGVVLGDGGLGRNGPVRLDGHQQHAGAEDDRDGEHQLLEDAPAAVGGAGRGDGEDGCHTRAYGRGLVGLQRMPRSAARLRATVDMHEEC